VAAASLAALDIVENEPERREALRRNAERLRAGFRRLGLPTLESEAHIVPVVIGDAGRTMTFERRLLEEGIFISGIRPPTVPQGTSRLRVAAMATHSAEQITEALQAFQIVHRNVEMGSF
jgi:7-keto-8-aminopelargonate synthetase-like enzyme